MHISHIILTSLLLHWIYFWLPQNPPQWTKRLLPQYVPLPMFLTRLSLQTGRMANMDVTPLALTSAAAAAQLPVGRQLHQVLVFRDLCTFGAVL